MTKNQKQVKTIQNIAFCVLGLLFCGLGIALCTKSNMGLNMIAACPYIIHLILKDKIHWFSQGTAEYTWQVLVLIVTCIIIHKFKWKYLFSFVMAILSGMILDAWLWVLGGNVIYQSFITRIVAFSIGVLLNAFGVACCFRTTLSMPVYVVSVVEISEKVNWKKEKIKYLFDLSMLFIAIMLSIFIRHSYEGLGVGTIIVAIVNAPIIGFFGAKIDNILLI